LEVSHNLAGSKGLEPMGPAAQMNLLLPQRDIGGNNMKAQRDDALLTPAEVAALFRVDPKTVTRWAKAGKLSSIRTLGGHRRYRADEVRKFLDGANLSGSDDGIANSAS
jgi:excisionase family DNA binding protein